jgi:hypothetical protein
MALMQATVFATHVRLGRLSLIYGAFLAAIFIPWGAELIGWAPSTISFAGGDFVLHAVADRLDPIWAQFGLALFVAAVLAIGLGLARTSALERHRMQRALQLQTWQLRQLVPRA